MLTFALKTLFSDRGKLLIGTGGVVFSLVLVCVQGGLYLGLMRKASVLIDHCDADLWIGHQRVDNVDLAREIPYDWIKRVRGLNSVESVDPYIVGKGTASFADGRMEDVWIIGSDPSSMQGSAWNFQEGSLDDLKRADGFSFDEVDLPKLGDPRVGDSFELNGHRAQFVARTRGITGFITMPYLFTTFETARRMSHVTPGACSFFLVKSKPGADVAKLREVIQQRLPAASVYTPSEFARVSRDYWMKRTGIGISFGASTALGLLVGLMMIGQSLYALALDHLIEYCTLKALGADDRHICSVIISQALIIASAGSLMGLGIVTAISKLWNSSLAPIEIPAVLVGVAIAIVLVISLGAALLPFVRIRRVDPALVLMG